MGWDGKNTAHTFEPASLTRPLHLPGADQALEVGKQRSVAVRPLLAGVGAAVRVQLVRELAQMGWRWEGGEEEGGGQGGARAVLGCSRGKGRGAEFRRAQGRGERKQGQGGGCRHDIEL